jgi:RsmE family RNA methyltransferase
MNLILLQPEDFRDDGMAELSDHRAGHIRKILKAEPGDSLRIGMLEGPLGKGVVLLVDKHKVCLQCVFNTEAPPVSRVDLLLAMPRPKVLKRLWSQLAALGVGRIVLLNAEKVERYYFDSHVIKPDFYTEKLTEGLQQARCTHLPEVLVRPRFKPFVEDELSSLFSGCLKLLADPSGEKRAGAFDFSDKRVLLAIGPEGGWTSYELEKLQDYGFELFGMGSRILRTDTACVGLLTLLSEHLNHPLR